MKPVLIPHASYQEVILSQSQLREHYNGGILVIVNEGWPFITKLWMTDLSSITTLLFDLYDAKGPIPRDPASMLRSFLILLMTKSKIGLTKWVNKMKRAPLYATLRGFAPLNIPGIGSFYNFFKRLWAASGNNHRSNKTLETGGDIKISPKGIPICPAGLEMKPNGYDHTKDRQKWRCPLACDMKNSCTSPCSKATYGRIFHTSRKGNLRLFPKASRNSDKWKMVYKRRTSIERSN